ncbi:MAG: M6 family metalloprotease domain-containing protein [Phycisphaerae bacterium]|nr:M6 family metalloprotease domain-containing protein [Phycisphaerae bacterium]
MRKKILDTFLVLVFLLTSSVWAAPYNGQVFELKQPDGNLIEVKIWGDEFFQHVESLDGYTLMRDKKGCVYYAELNSDGSDLVSTGYKYKGHSNEKYKSSAPAGLAKGLWINKDAIYRKVKQKKIDLACAVPAGIKLSPEAEAEAIEAETTKGINPAISSLPSSVVGLTLLIDFSDENATIPVGDIYNYVNERGYSGNGNKGSVRDYYFDVSGGKLVYTNHVTEYYRARHPKSYYTDPSINYGVRAKELILEALGYLERNTNFDFSQLTLDSNDRFIAINAFYAGGTDNAWAQGLWPHKSGMNDMYTTEEGFSTGEYQITNIGSSLTLGTFCHENGHMVCDWPDLYDYGYESAGVGNFCLMASGGNNKNPVPPCAYLREIHGWDKVIDITNVNEGSEYTHIANSNEIYKYSNPEDKNEYFLIESRMKKDRNLSLPDEGLLIWHIDRQSSNDDEQMTPDLHYKVSVEQADGKFELEHGQSSGGAGDLFHKDYVDLFDDETTPNANWWDGSDSGLIVCSIGYSGETVSFCVGWPKVDYTGLWHLNETYNDDMVKDYSEYDNHGTVVGQIQWVDGFGDGTDGLKLDGTNYIDLTAAPGSDDVLSAAMWFKADKYADMILLDKSPLGNSGIGWKIKTLEDGRLEFIIGSDSNSKTIVTPGLAYIPDQWYHVFCSYDLEGTAKIYVNGFLAREINNITNVNVSEKNTVLRLGASATNPEQDRFYGVVDDVRIALELLTDVEMQELPGLFKSGRAADTVGIWHFQEQEGDLARDYSGNHNDLLLSDGLKFGDSSVPGRTGEALYLNGTQYCTAKSYDGLLNEITFVTWVKRDGDQTSWAGLGTTLGARPAFALDIYSSGFYNELRYRWGASAAARDWHSNVYVPAGKWVMVALVVNKDKATVYLHDGRRLTKAENVVPHANIKFDADLHIGYDQDYNGYFKGAIDDTRFFTYAMTENEIKALGENKIASFPNPVNNSHGKDPVQLPFTWVPGPNVAIHHVYLGQDYDAIENADMESPLYQGSITETEFKLNLLPSMMYYWRVDEELGDGTIYKGNVWQFKTEGIPYDPPVFDELTIDLEHPVDVNFPFGPVSIAGHAQLPENTPEGSTLHYSLISRPGQPDWLNVSPDGDIGGTPDKQIYVPFRIKADDGFGNYDSMLVGIEVIDMTSGNEGLVDFAQFSDNWGGDARICDLNFDGIVDIEDFAIMLSNWLAN